MASEQVKDIGTNLLVHAIFVPMWPYVVIKRREYRKIVTEQGAPATGNGDGVFNTHRHIGLNFEGLCCVPITSIGGIDNASCRACNRLYRRGLRQRAKPEKRWVLRAFELLERVLP